MTIGLIMLAALVQALVFTSRHYQRAETLAQMQEQADVAVRFLREDLQLAGHWAMSAEAARISGRATTTDDNPDALRLPVQCADAITTRLTFSVEAMANTTGWGCAATNVALADGLIVRYARPVSMAPQPGRLQLLSAPIQSRLIEDGVIPATWPAPFALHDLQVMAYYVAPSSSVFPDQPVLKRVTLNATTHGPRYIDEEIIAGVEAMQVSIDVDSNNDQIADNTLQAGDPALAMVDAENRPLLTPLAVSVSLVLRSETAGWPEVAPQRFRLGDLDWLSPADGHLRLSTTISVRLRNAVMP